MQQLLSSGVTRVERRRSKSNTVTASPLRMRVRILGTLHAHTRRPRLRPKDELMCTSHIDVDSASALALKKHIRQAREKEKSWCASRDAVMPTSSLFQRIAELPRRAIRNARSELHELRSSSTWMYLLVATPAPITDHRSHTLAPHGERERLNRRLDEWGRDSASRPPASHDECMDGGWEEE